MKKICFLLLSFSCPFFLSAQSFLGYRTGNYTGVYSSFFNPAGIAENSFKWDVSVIGGNAEISNNNKFFKFNDLRKVLNGSSDLGRLGNTYDIMNAFAGADFTGPSFMISKKKWGIALTSRVRAMVNITDLDGNLLNAINNFRPTQPTPFTLNSSANQMITANGWTEAGLSFAKVLHENDKSVFKMGITGKYLAGAANTWLQVKDLRGTIYKDAASNYYLSDASGSVFTGYSGFDVNNFQISDLFKMKGNGWGAALGFIYELKNRKDSSLKNTSAGHTLRLGVSLTDIGMIKYNAVDFDSYSMAISSPQMWYPSALDGKSINEIHQYIDASPYFTKNTTGTGLNYNVKMPMALNINADIAMSRIFYTDVSAHVNLAGKSDTYSPFLYTAFSVTPRFETTHFGFYFPFTYSTLSDFTAGLSLRLGPVFVGSGSLFMALLDNSKQADVHIGVRFGGLAGKSKKEKKKKIKEEPVVQPEIKKDTDKDGIPDADDKCPEVFGMARHDGCPVPDTDGDGINDEEDKCASIPGTEKYGGCPAPDTDKDGVDDEKDKCPSIPGTAANNGCPEVKKEITEKVSYAARRVYFNTASYQLRTVSYKGLNEVASILKSDPDLKLTVEGHTDNVGIADKNKILSLQRAYAVKEYLVKRGIKADRITIAGYGEEQPVASNNTPEGRAQNRRVVMRVEY